MKTNFFQQIAGLGFNGNSLLHINQDETGVLTVCGTDFSSFEIAEKFVISKAFIFDGAVFHLY